ncbi:MAG: D-alanine--D-alanine ligase family protein, partial [Pygmaiobacter sp.]
LLSATSVLSNIPADQYDVVMLGITKSGCWLSYRGPVAALADGSWEHDPANLPAFISPDPSIHGIVYLRKGRAELERVDVVFPVLHGKGGEDGTLQGLLELAEIPYVGCGVLGSAICMDKVVADLLMDAAGIARCEWDYMCKSDADDFDALEARVAAKLHYPIFVKPANAGSSVGITKAHDKEELRGAIALALRHDDRVLFERFVDGHEVECAVIGNAAVTSTLPGEILASKEFYDYEDKYLAGTSRVAIPAELSPEKLCEVQSVAVRAYKLLCCTGLARADFFVERATGKVLLNEINTLPGFTAISMYPKLMMNTGISYGELLDRLIRLAFERKDSLHG